MTPAELMRRRIAGAVAEVLGLVDARLARLERRQRMHDKYAIPPGMEGEWERRQQTVERLAQAKERARD